MTDQSVATPLLDGTVEQGPSLVRKTAIGAAWTLLWRLVSRVIGLVNVIVVARLLSPTDFGVVAIAMSFLASLDAFSQVGVGDSLIRHRHNDHELYDCAFTIQLLRGLLIAAALAAAAPLAAAWFSEPRLTYLLLALAVVAAVSATENIGMVEYRRDMNFQVQFRVLLIPRLCEVATTVAVAAALQSYWALVAGYAAGKFFFVAMTYAFHPHRPRLTLARWRELAGFSVWTWASSIARMAWDTMGTFVVGRVLGPSRLAAYSLGTGLALLPATQFVSPIGEVLFPSYSAARHRGSDTVSLAPLVASTLLLAVMPLSLTVSAASNCIVAVMLGPQWAEAQPVVAVTTMACLLAPFAASISAVLIASGRVDLDFRAMLIAAAGRLLILLALTESGNLALVALGTVASVLVEATAFLWMLGKVGEMRLSRLVGYWCRLVLAGGITSLALWGTGIAWQTDMPAPVWAILHCAVLGAVSVLAFATAQLGSWYAVGRPTGPEELMITAVMHRLRPSAVTPGSDQPAS